MTNVVYPTPTQQARYDTQSPPDSSCLPCANCGERYEDHEERGSGRKAEMFCPEAAAELDAFMEDASNRFNEIDEDEAREDARLKAAGL